MQRRRSASWIRPGLQPQPHQEPHQACNRNRTRIATATAPACNRNRTRNRTGNRTGLQPQPHQACNRNRTRNRTGNRTRIATATAPGLQPQPHQDQVGIALNVDVLQLQPATAPERKKKLSDTPLSPWRSAFWRPRLQLHLLLEVQSLSRLPMALEVLQEQRPPRGRKPEGEDAAGKPPLPLAVRRRAASQAHERKAKKRSVARPANLASPRYQRKGPDFAPWGADQEAPLQRLALCTRAVKTKKPAPDEGAGQVIRAGSALQSFLEGRPSGSLTAKASIPHRLGGGHPVAPLDVGLVDLADQPVLFLHLAPP